MMDRSYSQNPDSIHGRSGDKTPCKLKTTIWLPTTINLSLLHYLLLDNNIIVVVLFGLDNLVEVALRKQEKSRWHKMNSPVSQ